jgi:hypothetical protein
MIVLGDFLSQNEDLHIEYKEFCFKLKLYRYYKINELYDIIQSGRFLYDFNQIILSNLYKYFDFYIPRYMCSFHNTQSESSEHVLMLGINDFNEVTGIPFDGDLTEYTSYFQRYVNMLVATQVSSTCCVDILLEIEQCKIDKSILDESTIRSKLNKHETAYLNYNKEYSNYSSSKKKWIDKVFIYKSRLESFLNNPSMKEEFIQYLEEKGVKHRFEEVLRREVIRITNDEIQAHRYDEYHYIYWLIIFKDERSTEILNQKPIPPKECKFFNLVVCLITKLSELRSIFATTGISYYICRIKFQKKKRFCPKLVKYNDDKIGKWRYMKRQYFSNNGPQCIDLNIKCNE